MNIQRAGAEEYRGMPAPFVILIDGQCSLCRREARFMQRLDAGRGRLDVVDIAAAGFRPETYGATMDALMGQIHGVTPDGRVMTGMAVFREAYGAVAQSGGVKARILSSLMGVTGWPLVRPVADMFYRWFARNRLSISAVAGRLLGDEPPACENGRCKVP